MMTEPTDNSDFPTLNRPGHDDAAESHRGREDLLRLTPGDRIGDFEILEEIGQRILCPQIPGCRKCGVSASGPRSISGIFAYRDMTEDQKGWSGGCHGIPRDRTYVRRRELYDEQ
jgi:hypothetical protein